MALLCLYTSLASAEWDPNKVLGAVECGECHEDEFEIWKDSKHQKNYRTFSRSPDAKDIAKRLDIKRVKKIGAGCVKCHYTVGLKRGKPKAVSGISCESCHTPSKDWFKIHNDYGGKGVKKEQETTEHKKGRLEKIDELGLIRGKHLYDWAYNCFQCHIVDDEKLINVGKHPTGNDFDLLKYSQNKIRHNPKANESKRRLIDQVGNAMAIQFSLKALASTDPALKYGKKLESRYLKAMQRLIDANKKTNSPDIEKIISITNRVNTKNAKSLLKAAAAIELLTIKISGSKNIIKNPSVSIVSPKKTVKQNIPSNANLQPARESIENTKPAAAPEPEPEPVLIEIKPATSDTQGKTHKQAIQSLRIVTPEHLPLCITETPWLLGETLVEQKNTIPRDACFGIKLSVARDVFVQIYAVSKTNHLYSLYPSPCNQGNVLPLFSPGREIFIPMDAQVFRLSDTFQPFEIYAVSSDSNQGFSPLMKIIKAESMRCNESIADFGEQPGLDSILQRLALDGQQPLQWKKQKIQ